MVVGVHACVYVNAYTYSYLYRTFHTAVFLNTDQIHTKLQEQNILSPHLSSRLSGSTSVSVCYSFQEPEAGAHAYLYSDFYEGYGEK